MLSASFIYEGPRRFSAWTQRQTATGRKLLPYSALRSDIIAQKAVTMGASPQAHDPPLFLLAGRRRAVVPVPEVQRIHGQRAGADGREPYPARPRQFDPQATLSHISYHHTLAAPVQVKPEAGIFLEFAPIARDYAKPITEP